MDLVLRNRHPRRDVDLRRLRAITLAAVAEVVGESAAPRPHELAVLLVADREMAALNATHLQHDGPTDVITFDYAVVGDGNPRPLHGDIFIGADVARRQAREFGTSWPAELVRYIVHGLLHLQGHDDLVPAKRRIMKREEERVVRRLATRFAFSRLRRRVKFKR
jgi:probable rRNA maturation factor